MNQITRHKLELVVARINRMTNSPQEYMKDGIAQPGNFHLEGAYGGLSLHRNANEGGGSIDVLQCGYVSNKVMYNLLHAFIRGLETR